MVAFLLVFALKTNRKGYQHQKRRPTSITAKMLMLEATFRGCRHSLVHITNKKNIWYARDLLTALGSLALNEASCVFPADTNAAATSFDRLQGSQGVKKGAVSEVNRPECEVVSLSMAFGPRALPSVALSSNNYFKGYVSFASFSLQDFLRSAKGRGTVGGKKQDGHGVIAVLSFHRALRICSRCAHIAICFALVKLYIQGGLYTFVVYAHSYPTSCFRNCLPSQPIPRNLTGAS